MSSAPFRMELLTQDSSLSVVLYNNHLHYQSLYDLIFELQSYGECPEEISEGLQEKIDQTIVDYLNGTNLLMCFNHNSLCGLLSLSIKEHPNKDNNLGGGVAGTMLTIAALKGAFEGNMDISDQLQSLSRSTQTPKENQVHSTHYCLINRIYIRPQERNQGAASCLIEQALHLAQEQECNEVLLATIATYYSALSLYHKLGFSIIESYELPDNLKAKERTVYLRHKL